MVTKKALAAKAQTQFEKDKAALRYYMIGKSYTKALLALGDAERHHVGTRKDGYTPELHHQIRICFIITALRGIENEEAVLCTIMLHDVQEDYDVESTYILEKYGKEVADAVWCLTKKFKGSIKSKRQYVEELARNAIASLVKGADRMDNLQSMIGVFGLTKMVSYIAEARDEILPMLKQATKYFPHHIFAYTSLRAQMKKQIFLLEAYTVLDTKFEAQQERLERRTQDGLTLTQKLQAANVILAGHQRLQEEHSMLSDKVVELTKQVEGLKRQLENSQVADSDLVERIRAISVLCKSPEEHRLLNATIVVVQALLGKAPSSFDGIVPQDVAKNNAGTIK